MKPTRVVLADDHTLVRAGIRSLLSTMRGIEVVGEAGNGHETLEIIKQQMPDVLLLDIAMSGLNGLEVASRVHKEYSEIKIIMLSMHSTEEYVLQSLRAGAVGYLLKDAALNELEIALNAVTRGETYLSPSVSKYVVDEYKRRMSVDEIKVNATESPFEQLTPRQREVLQLIAEGCSTKDIARKLNISIKTADAHRTQLMERLDIHDVAGLVRYAIRVGVVKPEK
jgi:DNA-binding NarL/FixJ family response regulator